MDVVRKGTENRHSIRKQTPGRLRGSKGRLSRALPVLVSGVGQQEVGPAKKGSRRVGCPLERQEDWEVLGCLLERVGALQAKRQRCFSGAPDGQCYLRIGVCCSDGTAPGDPLVLEIWPPGCFSPVHNHGGVYGLVRILHGEVRSASFVNLTLLSSLKSHYSAYSFSPSLQWNLGKGGGVAICGQFRSSIQELFFPPFLCTCWTAGPSPPFTCPGWAAKPANSTRSLH